MKRIQKKQSAFFNLRVSLASALGVAGVFLALAQIGVFSAAAQSMIQGMTKGDIIAGSTDPDYSTIYEKGGAGPTQTPTGTACNYVFTTGSRTIVPGTTDIGNHCDDCTTNISLPFSVQLYDQSFTAANLSSNGNIQFVSNTNLFTNTCPVPTASFNFAIMPHWDDLRTDAVGTGCTGYPGGRCGIYTSTSGTPPNRIFNIQWRTVYFDDDGTARANFEVRLYENRDRFEIVYAEVAQGGSSATVGVQRDIGSLFTQFECNTADTITPGLQLVATAACETPTPTPTPTPEPITLTATGRKVGGINTVRLTWDGATSTNVDVYRDDVLIVTASNDGSYIDFTGDTGRARYTYKVCEAGTSTCSNDARVTFRE